MMMKQTISVFVSWYSQAVKKGLSTTMVGIIIGIFELVIVLLSPIYGKYVRTALTVMSTLLGLFI